MTRTYYEGMEDQLSALGLVLNCTVLWNTVYTNRALEQLRAQGYPVRDEDAQRLSAFIRTHICLPPARLRRQSPAGTLLAQAGNGAPETTGRLRNSSTLDDARRARP